MYCKLSHKRPEGLFNSGAHVGGGVLLKTRESKWYQSSTISLSFNEFHIQYNIP